MVWGLYPYPYPGYPALPSQTEKGVRNVSQTIVIFMVVQLLVIGLVLALLPILAILLTSGGDPSAALGALFSLLAVFCVLAVVYVVGLVLGLIGLIALHKGRDEFGPQHAQKIDHGLIVLIIGIIVPGIVSAISSGGGPGAVGIQPTVSLAGAAGGFVAGVRGPLLVGLFLLWAIETLATPEIRQRAMIALILGMAAGISAGVASLVVLYTVTPPTSASDLAAFFPFVIPSIVSAAISFVSLLVWYTAYRSVLDRFKRGELRAAPPAIMMPPPYATPYYPYAQPPYAPPAAPPPPAQPPPESPPPPNP